MKPEHKLNLSSEWPPTKPVQPPNTQSSQNVPNTPAPNPQPNPNAASSPNQSHVLQHPTGPVNRKIHFDNWKSALSTLSLFIVAPLIALFIAAFVIQSYQVDGESMETTLQNNDRLIVDKWPRTWSRITGHSYVPQRGNIIIFNQSGIDPTGASKQLIKRVIGLPGERVVVNNGSITIYNKQHPQGFNPDKTNYRITATATPGNVDVTLANDEIFVCGDNRANSEDSRYFGPIKLNQVVGKLSFRIIPLNKAQRF